MCIRDSTLVEHQFYEYFALVTDDVMADQLEQGHLNLLVKLAYDLGTVSYTHLDVYKRQHICLGIGPIVSTPLPKITGL